MYVMHIIKHWPVGVLLLLKSVATFFKTLSKVEFVFFFTSGVHHPSMWRSIKFDWNYTVISCVKCILGYAFRPSVNVPCHYEIGIHDSQQSYLSRSNVRANAFYSYVCFWNCCFRNKYYLRAHALYENTVI